MGALATIYCVAVWIFTLLHDPFNIPEDVWPLFIIAAVINVAICFVYAYNQIWAPWLLDRCYGNDKIVLILWMTHVFFAPILWTAAVAFSGMVGLWGAVVGFFVVHGLFLWQYSDNL